MIDYKLYVRDENYNRVAEIDDFISLEFVPTFNGVGTWKLVLPASTEASGYITKEKAGIIVVRNGIEVFSGPVNVRGRKWNKDSYIATVSGYDDLIVLHSGLAYPVPSGPPYTSSAYDTRAGKAETIMKQYISYNIGENARSERNANIKTDTDVGLGGSLTYNARFDTLLSLCQSVSIQGGNLGFNVITSNGSLLFQVYQPTDKTKSVIFSPFLGNLIDFEYTEQNPVANYIIAGGQGDGTARMIVEGGDSESIATYGRYEEFVDKRGTSDGAEIANSIIDELSGKTSQSNLSITPVESDVMQYGRDYNLGDKVTVVVFDNNGNPQTIQDIIRQVSIKLTKDGEEIKPIIGTTDTLNNSVKGIFQRISNLNKRLSNLERV